MCARDACKETHELTMVSNRRKVAVSIETGRKAKVTNTSTMLLGIIGIVFRTSVNLTFEKLGWAVLLRISSW